ncbi:hypothetical protein [Cupriavidus metallidurans]|uniref:Uncharacterized protein n=1 Tax=Cupriavidus metallidurans (strain ATCC 43123 / DSM 2839 / NBRC 102507 / CH34) TaxID=266264 RepID=Q1LR58_CUPMC|nr:hypothetical protein [Cupriavidus metallidurans]ABF07368.1 hypothetical protein; putative exported protein [Cupriavidus metallidurans CH34]AVA32619.1 hypothetical protein C3Z06_02730 [Cupriavidus metallidurans]QGS28298.1 hypothetical protein FOB83_05065 [Cupriavidus metallidurans]
MLYHLVMETSIWISLASLVISGSLSSAAFLHTRRDSLLKLRREALAHARASAVEWQCVLNDIEALKLGEVRSLLPMPSRAEFDAWLNAVHDTFKGSTERAQAIAENVSANFHKLTRHEAILVIRACEDGTPVVSAAREELRRKMEDFAKRLEREASRRVS